MFSWEPVTGGPGAPESVSESVSQVTVMAVNDSEGPVYRGKVPAAAASATPSPGGGQTSFLITPGAAQVKVSAEGTGGGVLQSDLIDLAVPDFAKEPQIVGTPALFRARTARDLQALAAASNAQPTAARQFSRTEKLLLRVHVTGAEPTIRMMSRTGDGMSPLHVRAAPPGSPFTHEVEVPLASLPAGDFLIEVKAGAAADSPRRLTGLKVTGRNQLSPRSTLGSGQRSKPASVFTEADTGAVDYARDLGDPGSSRTPAASMPPATAASSGRCGSLPASARPPTPTSGIASCWPRAAPA